MNSILLYLFLLVCSSYAIPMKRHSQNENTKEFSGTMNAILDVNLNNGYEYFEGDIILPNPKLGDKNAIVDEALKWGAEIPYVIHSEFSFEIRSLIESVLREISVRLCVRFVPRESQDNYLMFIKDQGCFSSVGMVGNMQTVSIGAGCEVDGIIKHETMHALGFWHEQSRYDRDDYVEIKWENIQSGKEHNFNKYSTEEITTLGAPYDYSSIMHYQENAFSSNGEPTIVALLPGGENMGQRDGYSPVDLSKLRTLYQCQPIVGWTEWTDWSECDSNCKRYRYKFCEGSECMEESAEESSDCDKFCIVGTDKDCHTPIKANGYGTVTSPLFPFAYKADVECRQTIIAPPGENIKLAFEFIEIEDYQGICYYDWLKIYDGRNSSAPQIGTYCGNALPDTITSTSNSLTMSFFSDYSVTQKGFLANYFSASSAPLHMCHFEGDISACGWTHDDAGDFQWTSNQGSTVSSDTGPAYDHTTGLAQGKYIFIETSSPQTQGMKARIMTPLLETPVTGHCLEFSYNMYGENIDKLHIYKKPTGGCESLIFADSGNHGNDDWITMKVSLYEETSYQLVFEGRRGNGWKGDMAIDDVIIYPNLCDDMKEKSESIEGSGIVIGSLGDQQIEYMDE